MSDIELKREAIDQERDSYDFVRDSDDHDILSEVERINEDRERDFDESKLETDNDHESQQSPDEFSPDDLGESLEDGVGEVESAIEWLEIGSSVIGGGVPVMEMGGVEEAINKVLEEEFNMEDMIQDGAEGMHQKELDRDGLMDGVDSSSGPNMNFNFKKGVK